VITDLDGGGGYLETGSVIAGGAAAHRELLDLIGRHIDEARLEEVDPLSVPEPSEC
jgi:hypothetical protein